MLKLAVKNNSLLMLFVYALTMQVKRGIWCNCEQYGIRKSLCMNKALQMWLRLSSTRSYFKKLYLRYYNTFLTLMLDWKVVKRQFFFSKEIVCQIQCTSRRIWFVLEVQMERSIENFKFYRKCVGDINDCWYFMWS